jgi:ribosomal-protein-alanine acetyltransferase
LKPLLVLRRMTAADVAAVMALEQASEEAAHWPLAPYGLLVGGSGERGESLIRRLGLVAEIDRRVVGFLVGRAVPGDEEAELENMAVGAEDRNRGVGAALMKEFLVWCVAGGSLRMHLEVRESNGAARRFYERHGFRESGRRKNYYKDGGGGKPGEDAVTMVLVIGEGLGGKTMG